jgi:hypothetical protein
MRASLVVAAARNFPMTALLLLLFVGGCHIQLVSEYDEDFVRTATGVQKEIGMMLQTLKNPPSGTDVSYQGSISAYNKISVDLNGLLILAGAHRNNEETVAQVKQMIQIFDEIPERHRTKSLSAAYLDLKQQTISRGFSLIIRTENDKKAGNG